MVDNWAARKACFRCGRAAPQLGQGAKLRQAVTSAPPRVFNAPAPPRTVSAGRAPLSGAWAGGPPVLGQAVPGGQAAARGPVPITIGTPPAAAESGPIGGLGPGGRPSARFAAFGDFGGVGDLEGEFEPPGAASAGASPRAEPQAGAAATGPASKVLLKQRLATARRRALEPGLEPEVLTACQQSVARLYAELIADRTPAQHLAAARDRAAHRARQEEQAQGAVAEATATLASARARLVEASAKLVEAEAELVVAEAAAAPEPEPFDLHEVGEAYPPEVADAVLALRAALQGHPGLHGPVVRSFGGTLLPAGGASAPKKRAPPGRFRRQEPPPARSRRAGQSGSRLAAEWSTGHSEAGGQGSQDEDMLQSASGGEGEDEEEEDEGDGEVAATDGLRQDGEGSDLS